MTTLVKAAIVVGVLWIVAMFAPLLWIEELEWDKAKFTTEWYRECVAVGKLFVAFLLGSVIAQRYKLWADARERQEREEEMLQRWRGVCKSLAASGDACIEAVGQEDQLLFRERRQVFEACIWQVMALAACGGPGRGDGEGGRVLSVLLQRYDKEASAAVGRLLAGLNDGELSAFSGFPEGCQKDWHLVKAYLAAVEGTSGW